jgi:protein-S-isoprenylcysteine O-methyltransferase Ste14
MPQGVAMKILENRILPPLVAVFCGFIMWLLAGEVVPVGEIGIIRWIVMLAVIATGSYFSLSGVMAFRSAKTTVNPLKPEAAASLVKSGIYQISRNPMYVGFALFLVSWAIYLGSIWSALGVLIFVLFITRFQILPEERAMISLFGSEFIEYSKSVRRWL